MPETSFGLQNGQTQDFCRIALDCKLFFLALFSILQLVIVVCATRYQCNSMMALKKARMPRCDEDCTVHSIRGCTKELLENKIEVSILN